MSQKYADIIIDISHEAIDRTFQYKIPDELSDDISVGVQVVIPFGKGNSERKGYVINISEEAKFDADKTKSILSVEKKGLPIEGVLIKLADWIHRNYGSTMINALETVMPVKRSVRKVSSGANQAEYEISKPPVLSLNSNQQQLVEQYADDTENGITNTYLLHGVTGSGKTEVYIGCIKECIKQGKQAIVLIPEIGLTYQNVARFKQHFGERVAIINSKQSKGEKYREFMRAKDNEVDVIIGPRSALFAPCTKLGLIVIDEEHDNAYKSDQTPKYHARDVAIQRAKLENAAVILGSATPSVESYAMAKLGRYKLWKLNERPQGMELSSVSVVDLRQELRAGNRSIVSRELYSLIEDRLSKNEQIMLFINRRGYNSCMLCRECGDVIKCPKCDVSMALHSDTNKLMCHYCGYMTDVVKQCPSCKSKLIGGFGTGTQKVEQEINKLFPKAKTLRMDKDTTTRKNAQADILNKFMKHQADILIGTQMIVKGHDFSNVTLVGVMLADTTLFANDYRAGERTFDLLTQAAGRAGRGEKRGHVLIQTYKPDHYAVVSASKQDYEAFFETEMSFRQIMKYPPVYNMLVVLIQSADDAVATEASLELAALLKKYITTKYTRLIGPGPATIGRINEQYRKVIYVKARDLETINSIITELENYDKENVTVHVDLNPMGIY